MQRILDFFEGLILKDILEIAIIAMVIYILLRFVRGTRGAGIMRGLGIIVVAGFLLAQVLIAQFQLEQLGRVLDYLLTTLVLGLIIIFQPELRRGLVMLGRNPFVRLFLREKSPLVSELTQAIQNLSRRRVGALVGIQRQVGLGHYADTGIHVDAAMSGTLLNTIFWPGTPLHDGGVIVREGRVAAAACQFPLSESAAGLGHYGMRHRAALGLSEETDAIVVVVSEESGGVSLAVRGQLRPVTPEELPKALGTLLGEADLAGSASPEESQ